MNLAPTQINHQNFEKNSEKFLNKKMFSSLSEKSSSSFNIKLPMYSTNRISTNDNDTNVIESTLNLKNNTIICTNENNDTISQYLQKKNDTKKDTANQPLFKTNTVEPSAISYINSPHLETTTNLFLFNDELSSNYPNNSIFKDRPYELFNEDIFSDS